MAQGYHRTTIYEDTLRKIDEHVQNACLGGKSHIRLKSDRKTNLYVDQLVGQLGEFALCRWLSNEKAYWERRKIIDRTPWVGDDGQDYPGLSVDVKTSLMRRSKDVSKYNLPVRPGERHKDNVYILALVETFGELPHEGIYHPINIWFVGWTKDKELPAAKEDGIFKGAHLMPADKLREMDTLTDYVSYYLPVTQTKGTL